ncbi:hypothetical protein ATK74_1773 [Propionicimonas paludicola]|uniref:Uncharacterized protein n=1 Tax=Propionicimonas paludicola TaxID=185243 RepID=A0A2A9CUB2_9ACTN|nr:hypothetical protein [Propionicimonas paludicola]PFG17210.1 hypothetical protein ATK74_1773 [Propionicimonas paludicola]
MTHRQKHKGKKRPRSWHHRWAGPDRALRAALRRLEAALARTDYTEPEVHPIDPESRAWEQPPAVVIGLATDRLMDAVERTGIYAEDLEARMRHAFQSPTVRSALNEMRDAMEDS